MSIIKKIGIIFIAAALAVSSFGCGAESDDSSTKKKSKKSKSDEETSAVSDSADLSEEDTFASPDEKEDEEDEDESSSKESKKSDDKESKSESSSAASGSAASSLYSESETSSSYSYSMESSDTHTDISGYLSHGSDSSEGSGTSSAVISEGANTSEELVDIFVKYSLLEPNAEEILEIIPNEVFYTYLESKFGDTSELSIDDISKDGELRDTMIQGMQTSLEATKKSIDAMCDSWSLLYKISDSESLTGSEFDSFAKDCLDKYNMKVEERKDITVELDIEVTVSGETAKQTTDQVLNAVKVSGKWYIWGNNGVGMFDTLFG